MEDPVQIDNATFLSWHERRVYVLGSLLRNLGLDACIEIDYKYRSKISCRCYGWQWDQCIEKMYEIVKPLEAKDEQ